MGRFSLASASLLSVHWHLLCLQPSPDSLAIELSSESASPGCSGEEGGDPPPPPPPPPGAGLALACHQHGLAAFNLGISGSLAPSWASETVGTPPMSCDEPELVDSFTCTSRIGSSRGRTRYLCLSCMAATHCHPAFSSRGTASKCAELPIHSAKASVMWECISRTSSLERLRYPCWS